jgi:hypothetical protein
MTENPLAGLATLRQPTEAWNLLLDVQGDTSRTAGVMTLINWTLDQGNAQAFEHSRGVLFALSKQDDPTFILSRLLRLLGTPGRYQAVHVRTAVAELPSSVTAFIAAHPAAAYASHPPVVETYRFVQTAPPPVSTPRRLVASGDSKAAAPHCVSGPLQRRWLSSVLPPANVDGR